MKKLSSLSARVTLMKWTVSNITQNCLLKKQIFSTQMAIFCYSGQMQLSYEHCMPKKEDDLNAKRTVVVFRHGRTASVTFDTGRPVFTAPNLPTAEIAKFGHPIREIVEAKEVFDRLMLVQSGAHR